MRIKVGQLRQIIREVAEETADGTAAAAEDLEATAGDWVADNYDEILAKLQSDPKLTDAILAAAGVKESYVGDLAKGVGDYYKGGAVRGNINPTLIPGGGAALGYLGAEIMALVKDPSLMPWTTLRSLQLDDKITMDGSAGKAMIVGALLGHLVDVARHAKEFADTSARNSALMARGRAKSRRR